MYVGMEGRRDGGKDHLNDGEREGCSDVGIEGAMERYRDGGSHGEI